MISGLGHTVRPRRTAEAVVSRAEKFVFATWQAVDQAELSRSADRSIFQRVIEEGWGVACLGQRADGVRAGGHLNKPVSRDAGTVGHTVEWLFGCAAERLTDKRERDFGGFISNDSCRIFEGWMIVWRACVRRAGRGVPSGGLSVVVRV